MLVLTRSDTRGLLDVGTCLPVVERAFSERGAGGGLRAHRFHVGAGEGAFHVTAGGVGSAFDAPTFGIKVNGRYPPLKTGGGQRVSGAILLADGETGQPIALLDSLLVTLVRTAAVTSLAVRYLAREDTRRALLVGAGAQSWLQVEALQRARALEHLEVFDLVPDRAKAVVEHARSGGLAADVAGDPVAAAHRVDVIVTITPATEPVLTDVPEGATVIALGADAPGKRELGPRVMTGSKIVVDVLEQAAVAGELASAISEGLLTLDDVHAELGEVIAGIKQGRASDRETIVFDATGTALQDVAASLLIVEAAREAGRGTELDIVS